MIQRRVLTVAALAIAATSIHSFHLPNSLHSKQSGRQSGSRSSSQLYSSIPERPSEDSAPPPLSTLVSRVAVAGATGRTGKLVVRRLLQQNVPVLALVRDTEKALAAFADFEGLSAGDSPLLSIRETDLGSRQDVTAALADTRCDAAIWCATGFSDAPDQSFLGKLKAVFGLAVAPKETIDAVGLPALGEALKGTPPRLLPATDSQLELALPKVVMLSSAGVTRPSWPEDKKLALQGSAGIPIVRLNPFGILDVKAESEVQLRQCGADYCIFRPGGLNDNWPSNLRPIFSQGDVAVGRINRADVAEILVQLLSTPECVGKTFEGISIANSEGYYPPSPSLRTALSRMVKDDTFASQNGGDATPSEDVVRATYAIMQQLLPGEKQDPSLLAMGQTYEQLDRDEIGRLGKRGEEDVESAAPKPTSTVGS